MRIIANKLTAYLKLEIQPAFVIAIERYAHETHNNTGVIWKTKLQLNMQPTVALATGVI